MRRIIAAVLTLALVATPLWAASVNVGVYTLAAKAITTAITGEIQTPPANANSLDGITAASGQVYFQYGSGGSSAFALVQTSLDGGTVWLDVARCDFTTATRICIFNLSGLTAKNAGAYAALSAEGVNDGLLGSQFRAVLTSVGTYVNTTLSVRVSVR